MADNITVTPVAEFDVVTDEVTSPYTGGTKHAQAVKLLSGTADENDPIPGDATNGLDVDVTRVQGSVAVTHEGLTDLADALSAGVLSVDDNGTTLSIDDGGGSITVDGTVTATASGDHTVIGKAADGAAVAGNPVLVAGQDGANVQSLKTDSTGSLQVDVESSALPSGAATSAKQDTLIGHADGIEGLLTTIDADTGALAAALKAEDAVHASGDSGIAVWAVRKDTAASTATTDGDYTALTTDTTGQLRIAPLVAGTANIGDVDIASALPAGDNNIGNVDVVTSALPTGASTSAKQDTIIGHLDGVEGILTTIDADTGALLAALRAEDSAAVSGHLGQPILVVRQDTEAALAGTDGDYTFLGVDTLNRLRIAALPAGTNNIGDVDVATVPAPLSTTGGGTEAAALRVTVANDSTGVVSVDDNGGSLTVDVGTALPVGSNAIGKLAANSGVDIGDVDILSVTPGTGATSLGKAEDAVHANGDVGVMALGVRKDTAASLAGTDGDYTAPIFDANGLMHVNVGSIPAADHATDSVAAVLAPLATPPTGFTALSPIKVISAATTNATSIKTSAGQLYWLYVTNLNAAVRYLKLYNKASAPTVGTDTPIHTFAIPADTTGAGFVLTLPHPITFATGIALALTTGVADSDTGAVAANEIIVNGGYR
jgi:hypothetical protein